MTPEEKLSLDNAVEFGRQMVAQNEDFRSKLSDAEWKTAAMEAEIQALRDRLEEWRKSPPESHDLRTRLSEAEAESARRKAWTYCPECGSTNHERLSDFAMTHRECMDCGQEWHTDIDYSDVVAKNLGKREEAERKHGELVEAGEVLKGYAQSYAMHTYDRQGTVAKAVTEWEALALLPAQEKQSDKENHNG